MTYEILSPVTYAWPWPWWLFSLAAWAACWALFPATVAAVEAFRGGGNTERVGEAFAFAVFAPLALPVMVPVWLFWDFPRWLGAKWRDRKRRGKLPRAEVHR